MRQMFQGLPHRLHLGNAALQVGDMGQRDALDVGAGAALVLPQLEQLGDLGHAEARYKNEGQNSILFNVFIGNCT